MTDRRQGTGRAFVLDGQRCPAAAIAEGFYIVATPIGNLADISLRALAILAACDRIACEDTRRTATLLRHYGIDTPLLSYHEHNAERQRPKLLSMLAAGERIALVTDAGTPLISDPGFRLASDVAAAGHDIVPVPGASAMLAGLVVSALPSDRFWFEGFLPAKAKARRDRIMRLADIPGTLILYEAPNRLADALADLAELLPDRHAAIARELTKMHEEVLRGALAELAARMATASVKGEVVVMIGPPPPVVVAEPADLDERLQAAIALSGARTAADQLAGETGLERKKLYRRAIQLIRQ